MDEVDKTIKEGKRILYVSKNMNNTLKLFYTYGYTSVDLSIYTVKHREYGPVTIVKQGLLGQVDPHSFDKIFIEHLRKGVLSYEVHEKKIELELE